MITIYHNPRCSKSRQGYQILEAAGIAFKTIKYLETPLTKKGLIDIIEILDTTPMALVRKGETIWKEQYKGRDLSDNDILAAMIKHPKLIERPIVINENKGIIGRPPENIKSIL